MIKQEAAQGGVAECWHNSTAFLTVVKFFIFQRILVHSRSRTVVDTLKEAHAMHKRLTVYVTQSSFSTSTETASVDSGDVSSKYVFIFAKTFSKREPLCTLMLYS